MSAMQPSCLTSRSMIAADWPEVLSIYEAENSIYVHPDARGRGVGRVLLNGVWRDTLLLERRSAIVGC